jgi:hypothetical protein
MRRIAWLVVVSVGATGCGPETGKDGAARGKRKGAPKPAFTLSGPSDPVEVLNGKQATLDVTVRWGTGPKEELQLSATVEPADRGVTARPEPSALKADEDRAAVVVMVGEAAASGDYKVKLRAKGAAGEAAWEGNVRVPKKD